MNQKTAFFALAMIAAATRCHSQEENLDGSKKEPAARLFTVTVTLNLESFSGIIVHPVPPNTLTQTLLSHKLVATSAGKEVVGSDTQETGPARKPLVALQMDSRRPVKVCFTAEMEMRPGLGPVGSEAVVPLTKKDRDYFTGKDTFYQHEAPWFRSWIRKCDLRKKEQESDVEFARRLLQFMRENFTYSLPSDQKEHDEKTRRHRDGEMELDVEERTGECWALSRIYANVLRANAIPSRQISGRVLDSGDHHVRAQVFLPDVGWMHVEVAGAVSNKQRPLETCFGMNGDNYLAMNEGINFLIKGPRGIGYIGTFSYFGLGGRDGSWEWPKGDWSIVEHQ